MEPPESSPATVPARAVTSSSAPSVNNGVVRDSPQMPPVVIPPDEDNEEVADARDSRLNNKEIQALINHRFGKDETGAYRNVEGVLATLASFAEKYNDESIAELLYFDEDTGGFVWNEELLNS